MPSPHFIRLAFSVLASLLTMAAAGRSDEVRYNRDVRPILSENCFFCHGFDKEKREADLRLDTFEGATADLGGYAAVVPGSPVESELLARVLSDDLDMQMPPSDSVYSLTDEQKEVLKRWVELGAEYEPHWAYRHLDRPEAPEASRGPGVVDAFLRRGWEQRGAQAVDEASPRELLRRLSFDMCGLPPKPGEVAAFEADPSPEAYRGFVERRIDSLAYAEHQAVRWLDLVRWSDSSGMVSDEPIASGAYRAYVIDSFRQNKRFDRFTLEQLAGDLLPNPTDETLIASGYNRLVKTNCEDGVIDKEALYALKGEHVRAVGGVWLGATLGCAECHDHKYDPITAHDYYSMAAFFDDLVEVGVYTPGDRRMPLHYTYQQTGDDRRDRELAKTQQRLYDEIHHDDASLGAAQTEWEKQTLAKLGDKEGGLDFVWHAGRRHTARVHRGDAYRQTDLDGRSARLVEAADGALHRHLIAEPFTGFLKRGHLQADEDGYYVDVHLDADDRPQLLFVQHLRGAYGRLGWKSQFDETYYWGNDSTGLLAGETGWHGPENTKRMGAIPQGPGPDEDGWVRLRIPKSEAINVDFQDRIGMAWGQVGGKVGWGDSGLRLRVGKATELALAETLIRKWAEKPHYRNRYEERMTLAAQALRKKPEERTALQAEMLRDAFREQSQPELLQELRRVEADLYHLRSHSAPVLVSRAGDPKETRVLNRGDFMDESGPVVQPAVPEFLGSLPTGGRRATRLDLARWLVSDENPVTPRVFVNRLWSHFYGRGLSETLEDSGGQGAWPSHPELLDWLAAEFRDSGWDYNYMVRLLVLTDAYRLGSRPTAELAEADPSNKWHARQGRYRHTAEEVRDSALQAAGLLQRASDIPRESFYPRQPRRYWEVSSKVMYGSRHLDWNTSHDAEQHQRTVYTFWKRQSLHPTLLAFDAPTRQECTARRASTNTPGQALSLLNDPIFVEAAVGLSRRILRESPGDSVEDRVRHAVRITLQRDAEPREVDLLVKLVATELDHYRQHPEAAESLLAPYANSNGPEEQSTETAAWASVARSLLNLHEFLTRS
ncbi:Planctomycete cytochrome C [Planctomycetes bacterium MalM25]|nr:Planctomycete cytochrome C [Planctomycetes bacterium MalM25]